MIGLTGSYHEFGEFVSGVAALPRIVTLHDIEISQDQGRGGRGGRRGTAAPSDDLVLDVTAKTYRYLEESELAEQESQAKRK